MHQYRCIMLKIIDGDTVDVDIDLGFGVWLKKQRILFAPGGVSTAAWGRPPSPSPGEAQGVAPGGSAGGC